MAIEDQLQTGEEILYRAHPTRVALIPPLVLAALVAAGGLFAWQVMDNLVLPLLAGVVAAALLLYVGWKLLLLRTNEYVLTSRRMVQQWGLVSKASVDSYLDKLNNVEHRQDLWGRLLGYGDVMIDTASETTAPASTRIGRATRGRRSFQTHRR